MSKAFYLLLVASVFATSSYACDICGCGVSNYNPFLFPHLTKNYIGFTYLHRVYHTEPDDGIPGKEYYQSITATAQLSLARKLQLVAKLPYQFNNLQNAVGTKKLNGLGDAIVMLNYQIGNWQKGDVTHNIIAGAGVKLPTGKYTPAKTETIEEQNFQLGSGSVDYVVNGAYRLSYKQWMFGATAQYKYNTGNKDGFRFGDIITAGGTVVYKKEWKKMALTPYMQLRHEWLMKDASKHYLQNHSGGSALYAVPGVDISASKFTFGINYQLTLNEHLAQGQIKVKPAISANIAFTL